MKLFRKQINLQVFLLFINLYQRLKLIHLMADPSLSVNIIEMEMHTDLLGLISTSPKEPVIQFTHHQTYLLSNKRLMMFIKDMPLYILILMQLLLSISLILIMMVLGQHSLLKRVIIIITYLQIFKWKRVLKMEVGIQFML